MNTTSSPRPSLHTRVCAFVLAWQVFLVGLLAASPALHERLHHGAEGEHHACAVALFQQGVVPLASPAPAVAPLALPPTASIAIASESAQAGPDRRLPPSRGPPPN